MNCRYVTGVSRQCLRHRPAVQQRRAFRRYPDAAWTSEGQPGPADKQPSTLADESLDVHASPNIGFLNDALEPKDLTPEAIEAENQKRRNIADAQREDQRLLITMQSVLTQYREMIFDAFESTRVLSPNSSLAPPPGLPQISWKFRPNAKSIAPDPTAKGWRDAMSKAFELIHEVKSHMRDLQFEPYPDQSHGGLEEYAQKVRFMSREEVLGELEKEKLAAELERDRMLKRLVQLDKSIQSAIRRTGGDSAQSTEWEEAASPRPEVTTMGPDVEGRDSAIAQGKDDDGSHVGERKPPASKIRRSGIGRRRVIPSKRFRPAVKYEPAVAHRSPVETSESAVKPDEPAVARPFPFNTSESAVKPNDFAVARPFPFNTSESAVKPNDPAVTRPFPFKTSESAVKSYDPAVTRPFPFKTSESAVKPDDPAVAQPFPFKTSESAVKSYDPAVTRPFPFKTSESAVKPHDPAVTRPFPFNTSESAVDPDDPAVAHRSPVESGGRFPFHVKEPARRLRSEQNVVRRPDHWYETVPEWKRAYMPPSRTRRRRR